MQLSMCVVFLYHLVFWETCARISLFMAPGEEGALHSSIYSV